jgi:hypothetical protein
MRLLQQTRVGSVTMRRARHSSYLAVPTHGTHPSHGRLSQLPQHPSSSFRLNYTCLHQGRGR